ncbi:MAG TPA: adenylate/guanylate cyclase domain-containing protein [Mycobacteriales bacterium]
MTCGTCGTPLVPGARFCFHCGAPQAASAGADDAERRVVTVLFGDLTDFTAWAEDLDPERVGVVTDRLLAALTGAVTEVGGHVDKLTGDGIMAVFGAPTAHEDDAERAVRAAAAMQREVQRLVSDETGGGRRLGLRVGLNTGVVLAGIQASVSYTVVGDTVNTASRLSDEARPGGVYAGRETADATRHMASWRELAPLRLKGKREPVPAYELLGLRSGTPNRLGLGDEAPTIGREAERGALVGRLRSVVDRGAPASVLVVGDAGVGKTRLARELVRAAERLPAARVLWAQCVPYGLARDLAPLAQLVRTACGVAEDDPPGRARERVERSVNRLDPPPRGTWSPPALVEQLTGLLGLTSESGRSGRDVATPGVRVERPDVDGLVALLGALAQAGPLVLVVDDVHVASDALRDALVEVMSRVAGPILFLGCGRSVDAGDGRGWAALPEVEVLPVEPLERIASERLLRAYLGGEPAGHDLDRLVERAEGNPFFLAEMLHLLVDRGLLVRGDDGWRLRAEIPPDLLPAGVRAVLAARIDALEPVARSLLRDAAVLGSSFPLSALAAIDRRVEPAVVAPTLEALVGRGTLERVGPGRYAFAHTLVREVAYAGLPKADRARRHAAVAQWAVAHPEAAGAEADAVAAVQADRAVRLAQEMNLPAADPAWEAAGLGLAAARRLAADALARDDHASAEEHLRRAMRLAGARGVVDPATRDAVQAAQAQALAGLRRLEEAEALLAGPLVAGDGATRAAAHLVLGDVRRKQGDAVAARKAFEEAFALAGAHGVEHVSAGAQRELGLLDLFEGRFRDAERRFAEALARAEQIGDRRGAGWSLQHLAWSALTRADYDLVEDVLRQASEVFDALQDTGGLAWCAGTEALVRVLQGRHREARATVAGLLPVAQQMGAGWEVAACRTIDAIAAAELGELGTAREQIALAVEGFEALDDSWGLAMAGLGEAIVARGLGETRAARTALRRSISGAAEAHHPALELLATVLVGLLHLDRVDNRAAAAAADRAGELAGTLDLSESALSAQMVLRAQVLRARGQLDEAYDLLDAAARTDQPTLLFPRRQAVAHLAGVLLQRGDVAGAHAAISRAQQVPAEDVRSRVVTQRVLADVLAAEGDVDRARAAADEALRLVQESGLLGELPATKRLRSRLRTKARK